VQGLEPAAASRAVPPTANNGTASAGAASLASDDPHFAQNFALSLFSVEHEEHFTLFSLSISLSRIRHADLTCGLHVFFNEVHPRMPAAKAVGNTAVSGDFFV
jgi:hypothetical protein